MTAIARMPACPLGVEEVHLRVVSLAAPSLQQPELLCRYEELLSPDERARRERYVFARHRHQALVARALVRTTLSRYAPTVPPGRWVFAHSTHGRPEIAGPEEARGLRFNLSHTPGLIVCAVSLGRDLGVDVEDIRRRLDDLGIAQRYFTRAEVEQLRRLPEEARRARFFEHWTLKEAYLKARGEGLTGSLRHVGFSVGGGRIEVTFAPELMDDAAGWRFALLRPVPHHRCALAARLNGVSGLSVRVDEVVPLSDERPLSCAVLATS